MRHVFLVNPAAGQQDQTARFAAMADSLHQRHGLNCTLPVSYTHLRAHET